MCKRARPGRNKWIYSHENQTPQDLRIKDKSRITAALAAKNQTVSGTWHRLGETGFLAKDSKPSKLGTDKLYTKKLFPQVG